MLERRPWHAGMASLTVGLALSEAIHGAAVLAVAFLIAATGLALRGPARLPDLPLTAGAVGGACALLVVFGAALGARRIEAIDSPARLVRDGRQLSADAHLLARPRPSPFGSSAEVQVVSGRHAGARLLARAPHWIHWPRRTEPGMGVRLRGRLRRPRSPPSASFDFAAHLRRRGVAGEVLLDRVRATARRREGLAGAVDRMRSRVERAMAAGLPRAEERLARGMVLGQDEAIPDRVREEFRASGLAHLLAVSGQNVMLLAALAVPALAALRLRSRARAAALLALIAVYVPLAGAGPSLQRAAVMGAAGVVALAASRPASRSYALLLAAAATLALNPRVVGDPGWQLSFAAVVGILLVAGPLRRALGPLPKSLGAGVAVTVAAGVATLPLLAHHFGAVSLATLPANLLALPAVAPAMWLGMAKMAVGQVDSIAWLAEPLGAAARPVIAYIAWLAERFGSLPGATVGAALDSSWSVACAYAGLGAAWVAARRVGRRLEPWAAGWAAGWRRRPRRERLAALAATAAIGAVFLWRLLGPPDPPKMVAVSFLDVGQGDATLIQHPDGTAVLFDGGPPEAGVAGLLRRAGVRRLAAVVATHASRDHHGGLAEVIERYPVDLLLDGGDGSTDPGYRDVLASARRRGVRRLPATAPLALRIGGLRLRMLSPPPRPRGPPPEDPNPRAVVAVVSAGRFDLMLSADAESEALSPLHLPDVEAMKVPHHGSSDPGLPEVLERLRPEVAAIEVGRNTYGHPAPSTLAALRRAGVPTYRTDRHGTVRVTVEGGSIEVNTER